jgi:hypothetical protein
MFTLEGIGLPQGAEVQDRVLGLRYRFGAEPKLSAEFLQSVIAPEAGNVPTSSNPAARADLRTSAPVADGAIHESSKVSSGAPTGLVAGSARNPWIWAIIAALTASAGTGGVLVWRRKWQQEPEV